MDYKYNYMIEEIIEVMSGFGSLSSTLSLVAYVFSSLAIYTIAQRRCINQAWMAWVPVINIWILGSISDQYRYVVKDQVKSKRKILLGINIASCVLAIAVVVMVVATIVQTVGYVMRGYDEMTVGRTMLKGALVCVFIAIPLMILSLVSFVLRAMALYDIYTSCEPQNNMLYLVLSLIPGISQVTQPLFLFLCRNKDEGMPPRREEPAAEVFEEPADYNYTQL